MKRSAMAATLASALLLSAASPDSLPDGEWLPVPAQTLVVAPGSPLDFSKLVGPAPAGAQGPLVITSAGTIAFARGVGTPRFNCAMLGSGAFMRDEIPTHAEADLLVAQLRRHGYTLVRLHNLDVRLTPHATRDLQIDAEQLDRLYYLLAELKRAGIYWMADVLTGGHRGLGSEDRRQPPSVDDLRVRLNFDPAARALWLRFVDAVFARRNPYTGVSPLADPAMALVVGANENSIAFLAKPQQPFPTDFGSVFNSWVRRNWSTAQALAQVLPDATPAELTGRSPVALPQGWGGQSSRVRLLWRATSAMEVDTYRWMQARLAERGFRGPLLGYHDWYSNQPLATRAKLPVIDIHAYLGEVTNFAAGSRLALPSATSPTAIGALTLNASQRWAGRPFFASEYGQPFPNPTRYESGLIFPALAAMQGWSALCRTAFEPVEKEIPAPGSQAPALRGYMVGLDPAERAAETLSALLFFRGDMPLATRGAIVPLTSEDIARPGSAVLPNEIRGASLVGSFALSPAGNAPPPHTALLALGEPSSANAAARLAGRATDLLTSAASTRKQAVIDALRRAHATPAANQTDGSVGRFESGTSQLTIDTAAARIVVATPRTEAISTTGPAFGIRLGIVTLVSLDAGALVAASSLDGQPLARSRRILLILAGDTRNTGMTFSGGRVGSWGGFPLLMRRVSATLAFPQRGGGAKLTALSLAGAPLATQSLSTSAGGRLVVALDTGTVRAAPTTYFFLER